MDFESYQEKALRTADNRIKGISKGKQREALVYAYAALGVSGEVGELVGAIKKFLYQGRTFEETEPLVKDEIGDILWYLSWVADTFGCSLEECAKANIEKLQKRYPQGFTPDGGIR